MTYIFVSTDSYEAEVLIDPGNFKRDLTYHDIDPVHGQTLVKRVGFNPMCSIELNGTESFSDINEMQEILSKEGLFVAVDGNGKS